MIDYEFVRKLEGSVRRGYVPKDPDGGNVAGVTIGMGVDLGQHSYDELEAIVGKRLAYRLQAYALAKGDVARKVLKHHPLNLSPMDVEILDKCFMYRKTEDLVRAFNRDSTFRFDDLPDEFQTVTFSLWWHYGNLPRATPNFWRQVTNGYWWDAYQNLRHFGDAYAARRNKEADYVETWVLKNTH